MEAGAEVKHEPVIRSRAGLARSRVRARSAVSRMVEPEEVKGDLGMIAWAILFAVAAFFIVFSEAAKAAPF